MGICCIFGEYKESGLTDEELKRTVEAVFDYLKKEKRVNIKFTPEKEMKELNEKYRGGSGSTDVLSFDYEDEADIVLDLDKISELKEDTETLSEATKKTIIHGTLHLFGYDHEKSEESVIMEEIEHKIWEDLER